MKLLSRPLVWGIVLIGIGLFLLAQNFGLFGNLSPWLWVIVFGAASALFFAAFFGERRAWWFLFPAFVLAGLALVILIERAGVGGNLSGSIFLWAIAASFWGVLLTDRRAWWPIIPAGVMTTIGIIPLASDVLGGEATASLLFVGLGATFAALYLLRARYDNATRWAIWPAASCVAVGLFIGVLGPLEKLWPLFLIVPGLWMLFNALRPRGAKGGSAASSPSDSPDGASRQQ